MFDKWICDLFYKLSIPQLFLKMSDFMLKAWLSSLLAQV